MNPRTKWGMAAVAVIAVAISYFAMRSGAPDGGGEPVFVRMVSGPAGGNWYPLGAKIAQVLEAEIPGIATSSGPGGGVSNAMGSQHLHVRAFPVFGLLIVALAVGALAWIVWSYRPGDAITRESFDEVDLPSDTLGDGE